MTRKSTILNSPHKKLMDDLLNKGYRVSEVLEILEEKGIDVSRSALYRYRNSHFIPRRQINNRLYKILLEDFQMLKDFFEKIRRKKSEEGWEKDQRECA